MDVRSRSSRPTKPTDRLVDQEEPALWKPSKNRPVMKAMSDKRPAENQEDAWHFREETAKLEFHPANKTVMKGHTAAAAQGLDP